MLYWTSTIFKGCCLVFLTILMLLYLKFNQEKSARTLSYLVEELGASITEQQLEYNRTF